MPRDVDYDAVQRRIAECFDSTADDLIDTAENDEGDTIEWLGQRGSYYYRADYPGDVDHLCCRFAYNIDNQVANIIHDDDVQRLLQSEDIDADDLNDEEEPVAAAQVLLGRTPENITTSFGHDLIQMMSHPGLSFEFRSGDNGGIFGFQITKNIYPFSDEFRYRGFDEAVQSIVTVGHAATTYTKLSLNVQSALEETRPTESEPYYQ